MMTVERRPAGTPGAAPAVPEYFTGTLACQYRYNYVYRWKLTIVCVRVCARVCCQGVVVVVVFVVVVVKQPAGIFMNLRLARLLPVGLPVPNAIENNIIRTRLKLVLVF